METCQNCGEDLPAGWVQVDIVPKEKLDEILDQYTAGICPFCLIAYQDLGDEKDENRITVPEVEQLLYENADIAPTEASSSQD